MQHETSRAAYHEAKPFIADHRQKILTALAGMPQGGTIQEIADKSGLLYHAVGRRLNELVGTGDVRDSGRKGKSPTGRSAITWEIVPQQKTLFN